MTLPVVGPEVISNARVLVVEVPVIMLTGNADEELSSGVVSDRAIH